MCVRMCVCVWCAGTVEALQFTCGPSTQIRLWDKRSGKQEHLFKQHSDVVTSIDFTSDGAYLASGRSASLCMQMQTILVHIDALIVTVDIIIIIIIIIIISVIIIIIIIYYYYHCYYYYYFRSLAVSSLLVSMVWFESGIWKLWSATSAFIERTKPDRRAPKNVPLPCKDRRSRNSKILLCKADYSRISHAMQIMCSLH